MPPVMMASGSRSSTASTLTRGASEASSANTFTAPQPVSSLLMRCSPFSVINGSFQTS